MDCLRRIFSQKAVNLEKLTAFGFAENEGRYAYRTSLPSSGFIMEIQVAAGGEISASVIDPVSNEPYTLHLADSAVGSFVGSVKMEYEQMLYEVADKCFVPNVFKSKQAKELIAYVQNTYDDRLEYLWQKFPDNAVWRRKDNEKWYGALLTVPRRKIQTESDEMVEIIDLRAQPESIEDLVDHKLYFPGWHMNKKNWYTIILDGYVPTKEICHRIDESYQFACKQ